LDGTTEELGLPRDPAYKKIMVVAMTKRIEIAAVCRGRVRQTAQVGAASKRPHAMNASPIPEKVTREELIPR